MGRVDRERSKDMYEPEYDGVGLIEGAGRNHSQ